MPSLPVAASPGTPVIVHKGSEISDAAKEDLAQWLEIRGLRVPIGQVAGFEAFTPTIASVTNQSTKVGNNGGTYGDCADGPGAEITKLPDGQYAIVFSAEMGTSSVVSPSTRADQFVGVKIDGVEATDAEALTTSEAGTSGNPFRTRILALDKKLTGAPVGGHTITLRYKTVANSTGNATSYFKNRWLLMLRYAAA